MSGTVQSAPAGFFQGSQVNQTTAQDLVSATADALTEVTAATASAAAAATAATNATTAANSAASSLASIGTSVTAAATSATNAASSASGASTSATNASASATSAGASATSATASATSATGSASTAGTAATNAGSSATAAASSATAAASSATAAAASATTAQSYGSAILNNSALTGVPTAPTASALTSTTQLATTAYADLAVGVEKTRALAAEALLAPKASPALTGTPTAPTASALTNNTQVATTAYADTADALKAPLASPALTGTPTAPTAASGTSTTQLATTAFAAAIGSQAAENTGRNLFHNGEFLVQQRGVGAFTGNSVYSADRWIQLLGTSTCSTTITALADADRTALGDEAALFKLAHVVGGTAGAADFVLLEQRMEGTQRYGGKTMTVSFWAKAASGTPSIGVGLFQNFGSGGSPSASVHVNATLVTLSTTWTRYSVSLAVPTTIGKTIGTTVNTDYTSVEFWFTSGANNNTFAGGVGVQSATFSLWGMQAEIGSVATTFEKKSFGQHWQDCVRFYFAATTWVATLSTYITGLTFPAPMRVTPTAAGGGAGYSAVALNAQNVSHGQTTGASQAMTFSADL